MLRQFIDFIDIRSVESRTKFPLNKNEYGFYDASYTRGHDLRCPNCGSTFWAIKSYQHLHCLHCYKNFSNLGMLGMQELPAQDRDND